MSDPVTNVEIEDVLSSIRRLVSVDNTRTKRAPLPLGKELSAPKGEDKLVLTEDLRIPPTPELVSQEQLKDLSEDYTKTLERRIAELEAAVTAQSHDFEPDGSEDTSQHRPTSIPFRAPPLAAKADTDGALTLDLLVSDVVEIAKAETEISETPSDGDGADDAPHVDEAPFIEAPQEEADVEHAHMWTDEGVVSIVQSTVEDAEDLDQPKKDSAASRKPAESDFVFSQDDAVIDEDALRDMVAEIVRDELQGALGERITRNVRKLVRREIMRAISIRDFE